jgi:hypothetical protein
VAAGPPPSTIFQSLALSLEWLVPQRRGRGEMAPFLVGLGAGKRGGWMQNSCNYSNATTKGWRLEILGSRSVAAGLVAGAFLTAEAACTGDSTVMPW